VPRCTRVCGGAMADYRVITANGPKVFSDSSGYVLPHEHILLDMRVWWEGAGAWSELDEADESVGVEALDRLRRRPVGTLRENLVLSDWYLAAKELRVARDTGCELVVDLTTNGLDPVPRLARKAADLAGVDLVVPVGNYLSEALSASERDRTVEELEHDWLESIETGVDGCSVGIIGEIGTGAEVTPPERRSLQAAARTQIRSGLAINVHLHPYARRGLEVLEILEQAGADLTRVALSHCDGEVDVAWLTELLRRGCYVEFDLFGTNPEWEIAGKGFASDAQRVDALEELCSAGYEDRLLMSHDICMRNSLRRYGGWGYAHLATRVFEVLDERLGQSIRRRLSASNPLRLIEVRG